MDINEAKSGVRIRVRDSFDAVIDDPAVVQSPNGPLVMYRIEGRQFGEEYGGHGSEKPERCEVL